MPFFSPLHQPSPLPPIGASIEHATMDWKVKATKHRFEKAKDVAAFANHLGGTFIIGAQEAKGQLLAYVPLPPADAGLVRDDFSKAIAERCQPSPNVDFDEYPFGSGRIVIVNVWPSLTLVGVWVHGDKSKDNWGGHAYVYPVRTGTDAKFLEPSELAMYMTPRVRRTAVLLSRISRGEKVRFIEFLPNNGKGDVTHVFEEVLEEENLLKLSARGGQPGSIHVPLDRVLSVYKAQEGTWHVVAEIYR